MDYNQIQDLIKQGKYKEVNLLLEGKDIGNIIPYNLINLSNTNNIKEGNKLLKDEKDYDTDDSFKMNNKRDSLNSSFSNEENNNISENLFNNDIKMKLEQAVVNNNLKYNNDNNSNNDNAIKIKENINNSDNASHISNNDNLMITFQPRNSISYNKDFKDNIEDTRIDKETNTNINTSTYKIRFNTSKYTRNTNNKIFNSIDKSSQYNTVINKYSNHNNINNINDINDNTNYPTGNNKIIKTNINSTFQKELNFSKYQKSVSNSINNSRDNSGSKHNNIPINYKKKRILTPKINIKDKKDNNDHNLQKLNRIYLSNLQNTSLITSKSSKRNVRNTSNTNNSNNKEDADAKNDINVKNNTNTIKIKYRSSSNDSLEEKINNGEENNDMNNDKEDDDFLTELIKESHNDYNGLTRNNEEDSNKQTSKICNEIKNIMDTKGLREMEKEDEEEYIKYLNRNKDNEVTYNNSNNKAYKASTANNIDKADNNDIGRTNAVIKKHNPNNEILQMQFEEMESQALRIITRDKLFPYVNTEKHLGIKEKTIKATIINTLNTKFPSNKNNHDMNENFFTNYDLLAKESSMIDSCFSEFNKEFKFPKFIDSNNPTESDIIEQQNISSKIKNNSSSCVIVQDLFKEIEEANLKDSFIAKALGCFGKKEIKHNNNNNNSNNRLIKKRFITKSNSNSNSININNSTIGSKLNELKNKYLNKEDNNDKDKYKDNISYNVRKNKAVSVSFVDKTKPILIRNNTKDKQAWLINNNTNNNKNTYVRSSNSNNNNNSISILSEKIINSFLLKQAYSNYYSKNRNHTITSSLFPILKAFFINNTSNISSNNISSNDYFSSEYNEIKLLYDDFRQLKNKTMRIEKKELIINKISELYRKLGINNYETNNSNDNNTVSYSNNVRFDSNQKKSRNCLYDDFNTIINVNKIELSSEEIKDASVLILFDNLNHINLANNNITNFDFKINNNNNNNTGNNVITESSSFTNTLAPSLFTSLITLNLSTNNIRNIDLSFFSSLKQINLGHNLLNSIPINLPLSLISLNLEGNKISRIENVPMNLEELILKQNNISEIKNLSHLKYLKSLNLGRNKIERIGNLNNEVFYIEELLLYNNSISEIKFDNDNSNSNSLSLPFLKTLNLMNNSIKFFNCSLELPSLNTLNLQNNELVRIQEGCFVRLHNIRSIDVSFNKINSLFEIINAFIPKKNANIDSNKDYTFPYLEEINIFKNECYEYNSISRVVDVRDKNDFGNKESNDGEIIYKLLGDALNMSSRFYNKNNIVNDYTNTNNNGTIVNICKTKFSNIDMNTNTNTNNCDNLYNYKLFNIYNNNTYSITKLNNKYLGNNTLLQQIINTDKADNYYQLRLSEISKALKQEDLYNYKTQIINQLNNRLDYQISPANQLLSLQHSLLYYKKHHSPYYKNIREITIIQTNTRRFLTKTSLHERFPAYSLINLKYFKHITKILFLQNNFRKFLIKQFKRQREKRELLENEISSALDKEINDLNSSFNFFTTSNIDYENLDAKTKIGMTGYYDMNDKDDYEKDNNQYEYDYGYGVSKGFARIIEEEDENKNENSEDENHKKENNYDNNDNRITVVESNADISNGENAFYNNNCENESKKEDICNEDDSNIPNKYKHTKRKHSLSKPLNININNTNNTLGSIRNHDDTLFSPIHDNIKIGTKEVIDLQDNESLRDSRSNITTNINNNYNINDESEIHEYENILNNNSNSNNKSRAASAKSRNNNKNSSNTNNTTNNKLGKYVNIEINKRVVKNKNPKLPPLSSNVNSIVNRNTDSNTNIYNTHVNSKLNLPSNYKERRVDITIKELGSDGGINNFNSDINNSKLRINGNPNQSNALNTSTMNNNTNAATNTIKQHLPPLNNKIKNKQYSSNSSTNVNHDITNISNHYTRNNNSNSINENKHNQQLTQTSQFSGITNISNIPSMNNHNNNLNNSRISSYSELPYLNTNKKQLINSSSINKRNNQYTKSLNNNYNLDITNTSNISAYTNINYNSNSNSNNRFNSGSKKKNYSQNKNRIDINNSHITSNFNNNSSFSKDLLKRNSEIKEIMINRDEAIEHAVNEWKEKAKESGESINEALINVIKHKIIKNYDRQIEKVKKKYI